MSLLTACSVALCMTTGVMADPTVYDATMMSGQGFSVEDDATATRVYPGDKIANTEVYLGMDNMNAGAAEGMSDMLDDGTPCWTNQTGRVYSVSAYSVDTGIPQTDEAGETLLDENGNPMTFTDMRYVLDTIGGVVEVAYGSSDADGVDPVTGGPLKDTSYSLRGDQAYYYTDAAGNAQTVYASDIDTAAYPNGTSVRLTYDTPADPSLAFQRWSVYRAQNDGSLSMVPDDQISTLGIPELATADQMKADAVNALGGVLYITVNGMNDRLVFIPVFAAQAEAAQEPEGTAPEAEGLEVQDQGMEDPYAGDQGTGEIIIPEGNDSGIVEIGEPDALDAELNADQNAISAQEEPAAPVFVYEIYVDYIDPMLNGPSTGYFTYSGGEFWEGIETAQTNPEGLVFTGWTSDDDTILIEDAASLQTALTFDESAGVTENKVIHVTASYGQPETVKSALTLVDAQSENDFDPAQVEQGTLITVSALEKENLAFAGWTADGIELDGDQLSAPVLTFAMPGNNVTLMAQYREVETQSPVQETEPPVQVEEPVVQETEPPVQVEEPVAQETEPPVQVEEPEIQTGILTAQNAVIENDFVVRNPDGSSSVTVGLGEKVTVTANEAPEGQEFEQWDITAQGEVETSDITQKELEVTVSEGDITVAPVYMQAQEAEPQTEPKQTEPPQTEPKQTEPPQTEPKQTEPPQTEPKQTEPPQTEPKQTEPPQTEPKQTEPPQTEPKQTEQPQTQQTDETMQADEEETEKQYTLTVVSGAADQTVLKEGATATITAKAAQTGYVFSSWTVSGSGSVANTASAKTTFTMGAGDATVTANYVPVSYTLNVKNGSGSGSYKSGDWVDISADYPENGKEFDSWTVKKGDVIIDDPSDYYTGFTMPASDATVKATYHNGPDPNSNAITGLENDKQYLKGTTLSFTAVGAGMEKEGRNPGDYRYKPTGYQISGVTGSWSSSPYTTSMAINAAGDYTLTVSFAKEVYNGSSWSADGTVVTKSITFHVVTAISVDTGDSTPLLPLVAAGIAAFAVIIALIVILIRRRKR